MHHKKLKAEGKQVGRFSLIGIANTVIDFSVYNLLILALGLAAIPANLVSTTLAMIFSFVANKTFVFGSKSKQILAQAITFLVVTAFGLYVIQNGVIYILLEVWTLPLDWAYALISLIGLDGLIGEQFLFVNGAKVIATLFSLSWNYLLYRNLVFAKDKLNLMEKIGDWVAEYREVIFFTGIIVLAVIFRFYQLDTLPPGLHPDEAANGLDAQSILEGNIQPFYEANNGREGLFFYVQAIFIAMFGNTMLALRMAPAFIGTLAVAATYLAAKSWFSRRVGLISAFFMATAPWAVQMSRLGFRASLLMLFIPMIMWLVHKALETNKASWYVATGIATGLGFYTYISYRIVPLIAVAILAFAWWRYRDRLRQLLQPAAIVGLSMLLVLLPMIVFAATNTDAFTGRGGDVSIFNPEYNHGDLVSTVGEVTLKTAGMFHVSGDENYRHNLGGEPQLNILVGILSVLGLMLAIKRWRDIRYISLILIFTGMLLPQLLTAEGIPHALRAIGVMPVIFILAAIGLSELLARWRGVFPHNPLAYRSALLIVVLVASLATFYNYQRYFVAWANAPETFEAHNEQLYETAQHIKNYPIEGDYYLVLNSYNAMPVKYLNSGNDYELIDINQTDDISFSANDKIIVPLLYGATESDLTSGQDLELETVYSQMRPSTALFDIYSPESD